MAGTAFFGALAALLVMALGVGVGTVAVRRWPILKPAAIFLFILYVGVAMAVSVLRPGVGGGDDHCRGTRWSDC